MPGVVPIKYESSSSWAVVAVNVLVAVAVNVLVAVAVNVLVAVAEAVAVNVLVAVAVNVLVAVAEAVAVNIFVAVAVVVAEAVISPSKINSGGSRYETEKEGRVCLISDLHIFLFLISQVFEAFFENSNLILNILVEFLSLSLLTRFNICLLYTSPSPRD